MTKSAVPGAPADSGSVKAGKSAVPGADAAAPKDEKGAAAATQTSGPNKSARAFVVRLKGPVTDVFKGIQFIDGVGVLWYPGLALVRPEYFAADEKGDLQPKPGGITLFAIAKHLHEEGCSVQEVSEAEAETMAANGVKLLAKRAQDAVRAATAAATAEKSVADEAKERVGH